MGVNRRLDATDAKLDRMEANADDRGGQQFRDHESQSAALGRIESKLDKGNGNVVGWLALILAGIALLVALLNRGRDGRDGRNSDICRDEVGEMIADAIIAHEEGDGHKTNAGPKGDPGPAGKDGRDGCCHEHGKCTCGHATNVITVNGGTVNVYNGATTVTPSATAQA
ncbi:MAG: hypothetical protein V1907_00530 [Candidatus Kerfeldbacteria bacterium]